VDVDQIEWPDFRNDPASFGFEAEIRQSGAFVEVAEIDGGEIDAVDRDRCNRLPGSSGWDYLFTVRPARASGRHQVDLDSLLSERWHQLHHMLAKAADAVGRIFP
jgi:hypothetical protein